MENTGHDIFVPIVTMFSVSGTLIPGFTLTRGATSLIPHPARCAVAGGFISKRFLGVKVGMREEHVIYGFLPKDEILQRCKIENFEFEGMKYKIIGNCDDKDFWAWAQNNASDVSHIVSPDSVLDAELTQF